MSDKILREFQKWIPDLREGSDDNWVGCCPIHGEIPGKSKPSLAVNVKTAQWYCFSGCGGGGIKSFLQKVGRSDQYATSAASRLRPYVEDSRKLKATKNRQLRNSDATNILPEKLLGLWDFCPEELIPPSGIFSEEILTEHDIGFDSTHNRVTFPIRNSEGKLIGIVGKNAKGVMPKYKVYRKELVDLGFTKYVAEPHSFLWRIDRVVALQEPGPLYVVEGFKAALWLVQCGYDCTVALMGSNMSLSQEKTIKQLGRPVILCLDDDKAGRRGTDKIALRLRSLVTGVLSYPELDLGLQPDDLTPDELVDALEETFSINIWRNLTGIRSHRRSR